MDQLLAAVFQSTWVVFAVPALLLLGCAELGFRLGLKRHGKGGGGSIGGVQGAILGLLGLLLGFTFAMAGARYETRRILVVDEANAVGTAFLRADLLPGSHGPVVQDLFRRYVAIRIEYQPLLDDPAKLGEALRASAETQRQLWSHAVEAAKEAPTPIVATFTALNEVIDTEGERLAAARVRIPSVVWILILIVGALGCVASSYASGVEGERSAFSSIALPLLIAIVIAIIFDLMHPLRGLIGLSQQPLHDLQQSIGAQASLRDR